MVQQQQFAQPTIEFVQPQQQIQYVMVQEQAQEPPPPAPQQCEPTHDEQCVESKDEVVCRGRAPLVIGQTYCAPDGNGQYWDILIAAYSCDGTYSAQVQDDAKTFW